MEEFKKLLSIAQGLLGTREHQITIDPEYIRGVVDMLSATMPGDTDTSAEYICALLDVDLGIYWKLGNE